MSARPRAPEYLAVLALVVLGAALRLWRPDLGWFGVDQARDVQVGLDVAAGHDLPTIGPTMRRVTHLGVLYYAIWSLPSFVSRSPLALYAFAGLLGVVALVLTWSITRRAWGPRAGFVALAALVASPVAVINGRIAWAPAALPVAALVLLRLLVGAGSAPAAVPAERLRRYALLGAALGVAIQLHLSMLAWLVIVTVLVALARPGWRSVACAAGAFVLTGFPAALAALSTVNDDAGLATLPSRAPFPDVPARLLAAAALSWRVPATFWEWSDAPEPWPVAMRVAAVVLVVGTVAGLIRLARRAIAGDLTGRVVVIAATVQLGMVAALPGEAWYYYLDAALPLWALAVGGLVAESVSGAEGRRVRAFGVADGVAMVLVVAALLWVGHLQAWLAETARHGYMAVDPAPLSLDGVGGRDASAPGRLPTAGTKRAFAATVAAAEPAPFPSRWLATHGPAFDDVTGDNGFWILHESGGDGPDGAPSAAALTQAAVWYRDDEAAPTAAAPGATLVDVGPLVVARYRPTILYDTCRDEHGPRAVPIRIVPHPRRYGDGTVARPSALPATVTCTVAPGEGATEVVAALTTGNVTLRDASGARGPTGRESRLCIARGAEPAPFTLEISLPTGIPSDLDLYERPDPRCAAGKIAP